MEEGRRKTIILSSWKPALFYAFLYLSPSLLFSWASEEKGKRRKKESLRTFGTAWWDGRGTLKKAGHQGEWGGMGIGVVVAAGGRKRQAGVG